MSTTPAKNRYQPRAGEVWFDRDGRTWYICKVWESGSVAVCQEGSMRVDIWMAEKFVAAVEKYGLSRSNIS